MNFLKKLILCFIGLAVISISCNAATTTHAQLHSGLKKLRNGKLTFAGKTFDPKRAVVFLDVDETLFQTRFFQKVANLCRMRDRSLALQNLESLEKAISSLEKTIEGKFLVKEKKSSHALWKKPTICQAYWPACESAVTKLVDQLRSAGVLVFCCTAACYSSNLQAQDLSYSAQCREQCIKRLVSLSDLPSDQENPAAISLSAEIEQEGICEKMFYKNGVVYTNGSFSKGPHAQEFMKLSGLNEKVDHVFLIDDNKDVLDITTESFKNKKHSFTPIHYKAPELSKKQLRALCYTAEAMDNILLLRAYKTPFGKFIRQHNQNNIDSKDKLIGPGLFRWIVDNFEIQEVEDLSK